MSTDIIKPLHGLRGMAALTVVVGHFVPLASAPALGVLLFFLLSGFLIGKLYFDLEFTARNVWHYAVARLARVYPLFAAVIVGTGLLNHWTGADIFGLDLQAVPRHLMLAGGANTVWTISAEFQFYALFVPLWFLRSRMRSPLLLLALAWSASVVAMLWLGTSAGRIDILGYLHLFLLGMIVARIVRLVPQGWSAMAGHALLPLGLAYAVAFVLIPQFYAPRWIYTDLVTTALCAALLAASVIARDCLANRLLSHPIAVWLGEISFGVYLLHRHAQWIVESIAPGVSDWITLPFKIALALGLAQLANRLIERPARGHLRNLGARLEARVV